MWKATDDSDGLKHYGVLGMKWGVRHDKPKALGRGLKQISKDQAKAQRSREKAARIQARNAGSVGAVNDSRRAARYEAESARLSYKSARQLARGNFDKSFQLQGRAAKLDYKAARLRERATGKTELVGQLTVKAAKLDIKSQKMAEVIAQNYSKREISKFSGEDIELGRKYVLDRIK